MRTGIEETSGGLVLFGGGLPIYVVGHFVGAVGVSGGMVDQDVMVGDRGCVDDWVYEAIAKRCGR